MSCSILWGMGAFAASFQATSIFRDSFLKKNMCKHVDFPVSCNHLTQWEIKHFKNDPAEAWHLIMTVPPPSPMHASPSIVELMFCIDERAPRYGILINPLGHEEYLCIIDSRRSYARACAAMGFRATHLSFEDLPDYKYSPQWFLALPLTERLRLYMHQWRRRME